MARGEGRVTRLELFLDLIFVFAFLNVTGVTAEQLNPAGLPRGLLLLVLLWGCWAPYAWTCSPPPLAWRNRAPGGGCGLPGRCS